MQRGIQVLILLLSTSYIGCTDNPKEQQNTATIPFTLVAINASTSLKQLDIKLHIDGALKYDDQLSNQGDPLLSIPANKVFTFDLTAGQHTLKITSENGNLSKEYSINLNKPLWALFGYEYWNNDKQKMPTRHVEFYLQEQPIHLQ